MRKLTLIIALCFSMVAFASAPEKKIGLKINFGKPSKDCKGFGICSVQILFDIQEILASLFDGVEEKTAYSYVNGSSSKMEVKLLKQFMTNDTYETYFVKGKFIVEEDLTLPSGVTNALMLKPGYTIKKGTYNYTENANEIILIL